MYDARGVANFLLDYAETRGVRLTNMALLKHIYFAHGWHLASFGEPLVSNRIEAWQHGPVIRAVYDCFKQFGAEPINSRATVIDWATGEILEARAEFCAEIATLLRSTLDYYASYGAFDLSEITHARGGPWDRVWNARDGKVRLNMEILNQDIHDYFVSQAASANIQ